MIKTQEYMSQPVITADKDASVLEIVKLMNKHNIGSIVLLDGKKLAGIITERDVLQRVIGKNENAGDVTAGDAMTAEVHTVNEDASVMEISGLMKEHTMRRIVVIDENDEPVGIITSRDLIGLLV